MELTTLIEEVSGIGPVFQKKLKRIGIRTIEDLLHHFPHRYEDFSNIRSISKIKINEQNCVLGRIKAITNSRTWKKKMSITQALVQDKTGAIKVVWFNQPYLSNVLKNGDAVCLAGKASIDKEGVFLSNPVYEKVGQDDDLTGLTHTGRLIPVYPETEGLSSGWLRYIIRPILMELKSKMVDPLEKNDFMPLKQAIWQIHFPDSLKKAEKARQRFSFQELLLIQLYVLMQRYKLDQEKAPCINTDVELIKKFINTLPFKLTDAQKKCTWQILKDLERPRPMSRLLQGDVGSGKTMVAIIAALNSVKQGYQVAFMAPTEILAKQHFQEVSKLLQPLKIRIALLTGKEDKVISLKLKNELIEISRAKLLEKTKNGDIHILIGTHALIQDKVKFNNLGLCIVDEQHRFGVEQRAKLVKGKELPHLLSMTATPIPRTLALTIYGDLDLSILDEMPKGRKKIITKVVSPKQRNETYDFIRQRVEQGEQVFVVCPRIEDSDDILKSVKKEYEKLSKQVFPDLNIEMMHGKMTPKEKENIMKDFKNKKSNIMISTSVIEVGIDIPNATIMMIEGAERFGLAQLHQFRGRVGRSDLQSYCFLFTDSYTKNTRQRLSAMLRAKDGFELAQKDMDIRGPGSFSGIKQWGIPDLAMENLKDLILVEKTREAAKDMLLKDASLKKHPELKSRLNRFKERIHLE